MNDYGVFTTLENGTEEWVIDEEPLTLGSLENAIDHWSYSDACSVATYLTNSQGVSFAPGRPKDRQPK